MKRVWVYYKKERFNNLVIVFLIFLESRSFFIVRSFKQVVDYMLVMLLVIFYFLVGVEFK